MWVKNLILFQLQEPFTLSAKVLQEKLAQQQARQCGKLERLTVGWASPLGDKEEQLVVDLKDYYMIALKKSERVLPSQVIKQHVNEKVTAIEQEQGRKVGTRERRNLHEEMTLNLLPRAFEKSSLLYAYFDLKNQWLLVDTSNAAKAEELTTLLRTTLGSFKVVSLKPLHPIKHYLTQWLQEDRVSNQFTIDEFCEMQDRNSAKTVIRCVNQNLSTHEVKAHLATGKLVTQLALTWNDRISFILDEQFTLKRIQFLECVKEQLEDHQPETETEAFLADFIIFSAEFAELIPQLLQLLGGKATSLSSPQNDQKAITAKEVIPA